MPHPQAIVKAERLNRRYVYRAIHCAFLASDIVEAILEGRQSIALILDKLTDELPLDWAAPQGSGFLRQLMHAGASRR